MDALRHPAVGRKINAEVGFGGPVGPILPESGPKWGVCPERLVRASASNAREFHVGRLSTF